MATILTKHFFSIYEAAACAFIRDLPPVEDEALIAGEVPAVVWPVAPLEDSFGRSSIFDYFTTKRVFYNWQEVPLARTTGIRD